MTGELQSQFLVAANLPVRVIKLDVDNHARTRGKPAVKKHEKNKKWQ